MAHPQGPVCPGRCPGAGGHLAQPLSSPLSHTQGPESSLGGSPAAPGCALVTVFAPVSSTKPCPGFPTRPTRGAGEASPLQAAPVLGGGEEQQRGEEGEALGDPGPDEAHLLRRDSAGAEVLHVHGQVEGQPARGGTSGVAGGPLCFSGHSLLQRGLSCSLHRGLSADISGSGCAVTPDRVPRGAGRAQHSHSCGRCLELPLGVLHGNSFCQLSPRAGERRALLTFSAPR